MDIETVLAAMNLPSRAMVNVPVDRIPLLKSPIATQDDRCVIQQGIENITYLAGLTPETTGVPPHVAIAQEYIDIRVFAVTPRPWPRVVDVAGSLHRVISSPLVLLIKGNDLCLSMAYKNRDPDNWHRRVVGGAINWCPLSDATRDAKFLASLRWADLPRRDLHTAYHQWYCRVDALKVARLTGQFEILTHGEQALLRGQTLAEYSFLFQQLTSLKRDLANERGTLDKSALEASIARVEEQMAAVRESLRRAPEAIVAAQGNDENCRRAGVLSDSDDDDL